MEKNEDFRRMVKYMRAHWPSMVKEEWQVSLEEYSEILGKVLADFTEGKSKGREMVRIAGLSGSGKTTQLLPAVEGYFSGRGLEPVLVAARKFVSYHPHYNEILEFYGKENLRKMTDEFSTILMFMTLEALIREGYSIILDVTLLDPEIEGILVKMIKAAQYRAMLTMVAVSPEITEKFLAGREWRHTRETELEFIRATEKALEFYAKEMPEMRIVLWNTYSIEPVYDGVVKGSVSTFKKYSAEETVPEHDEEELKRGKIKYFVNKT